MKKIVGVQFRENGKIYCFDPGPFVLRKGEKVMVITEEGPAVGFVSREMQSCADHTPKKPLKRIFRLATQEEVDLFNQGRSQEEEVFEHCCRRIRDFSLPMRLVSVESRFDGSKIIIFFTADCRVDFRELVKELARKFGTKIEMRQIGVRHEAKMVGGIGTCGRSLCCTSFLNTFAPVTIKMAKEQNVSLNPGKISGMCGRLMCCLTYEHDYYEKVKKKLPKIGKTISTKQGEGKVSHRNVLDESVTVLLDSGKEVKFKLEELEKEGLFKKKPKKSRNR